MSYARICYGVFMIFIAHCNGDITPQKYPIEVVEQSCGALTDISEPTASLSSAVQNVAQQISTVASQGQFRDCRDAKEKGFDTSGVYTIKPDDMAAFQVYCDMVTDGGGWTVFQRRMDGSVDFFRYWADYEAGFGNLSGEYWLGNAKINRITTSGAQEMRVDMTDFEGGSAYAHYDTFSQTAGDDRYRMIVSGYTGTAGNSMALNSGQRFTTRDQDNDPWPNNCAVAFDGAWWYTQCHHANLNGLYHAGNHGSFADGVNWFTWKGYFYSLNFVDMKMRRK